MCLYSLQVLLLMSARQYYQEARERQALYVRAKDTNLITVQLTRLGTEPCATDIFCPRVLSLSYLGKFEDEGSVPALRS